MPDLPGVQVLLVHHDEAGVCAERRPRAAVLFFVATGVRTIDGFVQRPADDLVVVVARSCNVAGFHRKVAGGKREVVRLAPKAFKELLNVAVHF